MKLLSLRLDNFLLRLITQEARLNKSTKVEIIRAAIMNYFLSKKDIQDIQMAESRRTEDDLPFDKHF